MQNKVDSNLMLKCENEISRHCSAEHEEPNGILNCLKVRDDAETSDT